MATNSIFFISIQNYHKGFLGIISLAHNNDKFEAWHATMGGGVNTHPTEGHGVRGGDESGMDHSTLKKIDRIYSFSSADDPFVLCMLSVNRTILTIIHVYNDGNFKPVSK